MKPGEVEAVVSVAGFIVLAWSIGAAIWLWLNPSPPVEQFVPTQLSLPQAPVVAPMPLPNVVHPTEPGGARYVGGTGFFVTTTGYALTARHVVENCADTEIVSAYLPRTAARLAAVDKTEDLALLRVAARPPGLVGVAERAPGRRDLTVFGYPAGGDAVTAVETRARARLEPRKDATLWLDAAEVRPGFSGGPVVNQDGAAVGLIQGVMYRAAGGKPQPTGVAVGPDARVIEAFLRRTIANFETAQPWNALAGDTMAARKAVVRVLCRR